MSEYPQHQCYMQHSPGTDPTHLSGGGIVGIYHKAKDLIQKGKTGRSMKVSDTIREVKDDLQQLLSQIDKNFKKPLILKAQIDELIAAMIQLERATGENPRFVPIDQVSPPPSNAYAPSAPSAPYAPPAPYAPTAPEYPDHPSAPPQHGSHGFASAAKAASKLLHRASSLKPGHKEQASSEAQQTVRKAHSFFH